MFAEKELLQLQVHCSSSGCQWIVQKHADDERDFSQVYCEFLSVGCSHKVCLEMTKGQIDKQTCKLMNKWDTCVYKGDRQKIDEIEEDTPSDHA